MKGELGQLFAIFSSHFKSDKFLPCFYRQSDCIQRDYIKRGIALIFFLYSSQHQYQLLYPERFHNCCVLDVKLTGYVEWVYVWRHNLRNSGRKSSIFSEYHHESRQLPQYRYLKCKWQRYLKHARRGRRARLVSQPSNPYVGHCWTEPRRLWFFSCGFEGNHLLPKWVIGRPTVCFFIRNSPFYMTRSLSNLLPLLLWFFWWCFSWRRQST